MDVKVTRYGGFGGRPPKRRSFGAAEIDPAAKAALAAIRRASPKAGEARPDAYTYVFEITDDGAPSEVALSGPDVPETLRKLLP